MGREKQIAGQKLQCDAADRPDVCQLVPLAALQDHLRWAVLPSAYHRRVCLVEHSGSTEINNPYLKRGGQPIRIALQFVLFKFLTLQQYVLRLEVCMSVSDSMQEANALENLPQKVLNGFDMEATVVVFLD